MGIRENYYPTFELDEKLLESFINHLKSLIFRLKYNEQSKNPALDLIKKSYNQEFIMMKELSKIIECKLNCKISDDEIGYLTMYVCSTLKKSTPIKHHSTKNILIVCSSGFATGRVLEYRIKDIFDVNIIGVTSTHRISKFIESDEIDYIITTVKLNLLTDIPILNVPAIFTNKEINYLEQFLSYKTNQLSINKLDDVLDIISKNCDIINKAALVKDLNQYFKKKSEVKLKNIKQYITPDVIQLNLDVEDWQDAIIKSANPLLKTGSIEKEYIQAIIDNVNQFGAYIVVDDGVAIPHAKPDWYIHDFGITISTFKTPFIMGEHENIQVFITVASVNNKNHITLVTQIMKLIENKIFMDGLITASNSREVIELLDKVELVI